MTKLVKGTPEYDAAIEAFRDISAFYQKSISVAFNNLDILCKQLWNQLEKPSDFRYWPDVDGRTFGIGCYDTDPYWVSSSENC